MAVQHSLCRTGLETPNTGLAIELKVDGQRALSLTFRKNVEGLSGFISKFYSVDA